MIKLNNTLLDSSKINQLAQRNDGRWTVIFVFLVISAVGFLAPWSVTPNAGITLNAYDLAEWMSLSPSVNSETPTLLTSFLLRLGLFFVIITLTRIPLPNWVKISGIIVFGVSMLPPLEFLSNRQDPNYLQLIAITIGGMLFSFASVTIKLTPQINRMVMSAICILAVLVASAPIIRMAEVFGELQIITTAGLGYGIYILGMAITALINILPNITKTE